MLIVLQTTAQAINVLNLDIISYVILPMIVYPVCAMVDYVEYQGDIMIHATETVIA
jgi:hypothetical protein